MFTQFERRDGGELAPLPQKNIDVGLGLERVTAVLAGVETNFETDLFKPLIGAIERASGKTYGESRTDDVRMRRISDHVRAITFCITDGALPSNEGRGYVVRKILRRAARDGTDLGLKAGFLANLVDVVGEIMGDAYPEVREHAPQCRSIIKQEEETFGTVYRQGMQRLEEYLGGLPEIADRGAALAGSGEFAFQLHDTFGFPIDITRTVLAERGVRLDESEFEAAMAAQRDRARAASATSEAVFATNVAMTLRDADVPTTEFVGYTELETDARVLAIIGDGDELLDAAAAESPCRLVFDRTPFYAEGGGQVGDRGVATGDGVTVDITTTIGQDGFSLHTATVRDGTLKRGATLRVRVDAGARRATERNHTATHLMHAALKEVLGEHVSQAGSVVDPERLRFDYTHGERLTDEQIRRIEDLVNAAAMRADPVESMVRGLDEAKSAGFIGMFGEKYGETVRTIAVGEFSKELCGGTHVANSGNIGAFRIVSDTAISAGTRRIEAITGAAAVESMREDRGQIASLSKLLKTPHDEIVERVRGLVDETKQLRKDLAKATAADVGKVADELAAAAEDRGAFRTFVFECEGLQMKEVQDLLKRTKQRLESFVGVVFVRAGDDVLVAAAVSEDLTGAVRAGDLVKELAGVLGGGGGGRPELAQGKGNDASKLPEARARAAERLAAVAPES